MKFGIIKNLKEKDIQNLNSFFWLFSLDLKIFKKRYSKCNFQWINKNDSITLKVGKLI